MKKIQILENYLLSLPEPLFQRYTDTGSVKFPLSSKGWLKKYRMGRSRVSLYCH